MNKDLNSSYEEMSKGTKVYELSEVPTYDPPMENAYEKAKWNSNGFDQCAMKK